MARLGVRAEVLVADNGSDDGSAAIALKEGARVVQVSERGYGSALFEGSIAARGSRIVIADADDSYDFESLDDFVGKLNEGYDFVIGNRFAGGIEKGAMPWKNRYIGTPLLSFLGRLFFRSPVTDFNCGMRAYSRAAFDQMCLQTTGMEFASEMIIKAALLKLRVAEVPTKLRKDGRSRKPHLRPWRDGWRHLRFMLLYSPRWLFLYPGISLMALGSAVGVALLQGPVTLAQGVALDVHTLLFAFAAVLLGFQTLSFALFARVYAYTEGLLPRDTTLDSWFRAFTLEVGLALGGLLFFAGVGGSAYALERWSQAGFGSLDPRIVLRTAIPSVTALCLGAQTIMTSFLLSLLRLRRR